MLPARALVVAPKPLFSPSSSILPHSSCLLLASYIGPNNGRRNFTSSLPSRASNFDTLKVVQRLEAQGFTPEQSKEVMELLKDVIDESILGLTRTMVTREEQDKVRTGVREYV